MSARDNRTSEPDSGLPGRLPAGETLLWQGAPDWRALGRYAFHLRLWGIYFALLLAAAAASFAVAGTPLPVASRSGGIMALLSLAALGLIALFGWLVGRTTVYTITSRRVAIRFGVALPMTVNFPFARLDGAALKVHPDGTGDIALTLAGTERIAYLIMWPHARPWRLGRTQPMLRAVPDAARVAAVLAGAMQAALRAKTVRMPAPSPEPTKPVREAPAAAGAIAA